MRAAQEPGGAAVRGVGVECWGVCGVLPHPRRPGACVATAGEAFPPVEMPLDGLHGAAAAASFLPLVADLAPTDCHSSTGFGAGGCLGGVGAGLGAEGATVGFGVGSTEGVEGWAAAGVADVAAAAAVSLASWDVVGLLGSALVVGGSSGKEAALDTTEAVSVSFFFFFRLRGGRFFFSG